MFLHRYLDQLAKEEHESSRLYKAKQSVSLRSNCLFPPPPDDSPAMAIDLPALFWNSELWAMLLQLFGKKHLQHTWQSLTFQSTALPQEMAAWARKAGFYQYVFSSCRKEAQSLEELIPQKDPLEATQQQAWEALTWIEGSTISFLRPGNVSQFCLQCLPGSTSKSRANLQTRTSEKNKNKKISLTDASLKKKRKKLIKATKGM